MWDVKPYSPYIRCQHYNVNSFSDERDFSIVYQFKNVI